MEEKDTTSIGWFVVGLTLGALLGVLFAPKSGKETREGLAEGTREGRDYLAARGRQAQERVRSLVERGKEQVNDFAEKTKGIMERGRAQWSGLVDDKDRDAMSGSAERIAAAMEAGKEAFRSSTSESHS